MLRRKQRGLSSFGEEQGASHAGSTLKLVFTDTNSTFIRCCLVWYVIRDLDGFTHRIKVYIKNI